MARRPAIAHSPTLEPGRIHPLHLGALTRFLEERRLELDANPVENRIRKIAPTRKNALLAGHEVGAENRATLAGLVANCKTNDLDPVSCLTNTLRALLDGHPKNSIEDLMPCNPEPASTRAARVDKTGIDTA